jgi:hypothetical protein
VEGSGRIDPGVRYSDYNTVGNVDLQGQQCEVGGWVRLRGGYQYANARRT